MAFTWRRIRIRRAHKQEWCKVWRWGRLTELSFITRRLWDTSSFSRGKMTLLRYDSSLLWSNCHWASRTSCIVTMLSWNQTAALVVLSLWQQWCHSDVSSSKASGVQIMSPMSLLQISVSKFNYQTCTEQQDWTQHFDPQEVVLTFSPRTPDRTLLSSCIWPPTPSSRPRWTQRVRM